MSEKLCGEIKFKDDDWLITGEPHMLMRLRRILAKVGNQLGELRLKNNDETCRDLAWFLDRYNMAISRGDRARLDEGAKRHKDTMIRLDRLVDLKYKPGPVLMAVPPRDYQVLAAELLLQRGFLLVGDDVGTGKTVSALCALTDPRVLPAVVVTLSGTMPTQWERMTKRFLPDLNCHIVEKGISYPLPRKEGRGPDIVILNYHKLHGWAETLARYARIVIFDEAQELRRAESKKYEAATLLARNMKWSCGLSATPIFNFGGEIFNVLNVLKEDVLGTLEEFEREWCISGGRNHLIVRDPKALGAHLRAEHIMLRRTRSDVGRELPPLQKIPQYVESDERALNSIKNSAAELAKIILRREKTASWDRLRAHEQFNNLLRQATGVAKAPYVADFVRLVVENGESCVVFAWHREVYAILMDRLKDLHPVQFTGSESVKQKEEARQAFIDGKSKVILMSLRAGQGLDGFQDMCRTVIFAELDWSPGVLEQCIGRVQRDGQKDPVTAFFLVAERGADPTMAEKLGLKTSQSEGIRNPDADLLEELQGDQNRIRDLAEQYLKKLGIPIPPQEPPEQPKKLVPM